MHPARALRLASLDGYRRIEHAFDRPFGAALNPWRNLGALGFMLFWLLAVSGIYLYAVLDTSAAVMQALHALYAPMAGAAP